MPTVKKYCCGCSLRTGCMVTGSVNMFFGVYGVILGVGVWASRDKVAEKFNVCFFDLLDSSDLILILIVVSTLKTIFSIILVVGTTQRHPQLLLVWLVYSIVFIFLSTVMELIYYTNTKIVGIQFLFWLVITGVLVYIHEVVRSYRLNLLDSNENLPVALVDCRNPTFLTTAKQTTCTESSQSK